MNEELLNVLLQIKENLDFEINTLVNENNSALNPLTFVKNNSKIEALSHVINDYIIPAYNNHVDNGGNK